ncbi:MAG: NAD(P)-binding protein, partial [Actinomycetota bacterium]|nr:NAD(P)-binding protein [Actinomycetota bacterium]
MVIVLGAGPAGLAVAAELRRRQVPAVVVDKADATAAIRSSTGRTRRRAHPGCTSPATPTRSAG